MYTRDGLRYGACGFGAGRCLKVGLRRRGSGTGGWRYGRVGPMDGMRLGGGPAGADRYDLVGR